MLQLKQEYRDAIMSDEVLRVKVAKATGKRSSTVATWVRENHMNLTLAAVIKVITTHLKLSPKEALLEEVQTVKAA